MKRLPMITAKSVIALSPVDDKRNLWGESGYAMYGHLFTSIVEVDTEALMSTLTLQQQSTAKLP